jgi:hypothetical protein
MHTVRCMFCLAHDLQAGGGGRADFGGESRTCTRLQHSNRLN